MYRKHYLQRESLCFSIYRVLMSWLWALHETVSWSKHQTSIHLQDRASRDSFFAVLLLKSEHAVLFILKALLQEELWSAVRVSFWSVHLDETCCFHLTFLKAQSELFSEDCRRKIASTLMILSKKSYHKREASSEFWVFNWAQKSRQVIWLWEASSMILMLNFLC